MGMQSVEVTCNRCDNDFSFNVNPADLQEWEGGKLIQDAMPYLDKAQRELLISQTCDDCFSEMFSIDFDDEDDTIDEERETMSDYKADQEDWDQATEMIRSAFPKLSTEQRKKLLTNMWEEVIKTIVILKKDLDIDS